MSEEVNGLCDFCGIGSVDRFCVKCWPKCVLCRKDLEFSSASVNFCSLKCSVKCSVLDNILDFAIIRSHLSDMFGINSSHERN